jgi:NADPH:quinone reductase-like Zn-dependent oxidoreductase
MKAIIWNGAAPEVVRARASPRLRPDYVLISTVAVALNPTDVKAISQARAAPDGLLGCDFSGTILEVGPAVKKNFSKGDRVFGFAHGANFNEAEDGAWAEVIAAKGDCCMKMPSGWTFEGAATMGASTITAGQGLFQEMRLRLPLVADSATNGMNEKEYILIYGGSSSAGLLAIQFCRL